jgi:hypothetical protein
MHGRSEHLIVVAEGIDEGHHRKNPSVGQQPVPLGLPGSSDRFIGAIELCRLHAHQGTGLRAAGRGVGGSRPFGTSRMPSSELA